MTRARTKIVCNTFLVILVVFTNVAVAQLQVGDNLSMTMDGNLGFGYTGTFGNYVQSSHSQGLAANVNLLGYYFHPNFLSFEVRPYYDRAASSSESQAITRSSGIGASVGFFNGSYFPGSVSYGLDFSNNSEFYVAGVPNVVGDSTSRHFSVNWSELLPKYPHVYVNYYSDRATSTLASTEQENKSASRNLNVNADYRIAGFDLRGNLTHNNNNFTTPEFLTGEEVTFGGSGTTYGVTAQHKIPLGGMGMGVSHSTYDSDQGGGGSGTNYYEGAGITVFRRLSLNESLNYTTNTTAALSQSFLNGNTVILAPDKDSSGLFFLSTANLQIGWGLALTGNFAHRSATFNGQEYSDNQYGGSISFSRQQRFLGFLTFSVGFVDTANKNGNSGGGLVGTVALNKKLGHWETSGDFSYSQSVQTLYAVANTSSISYGGTLRRKLRPATYWSGSYRATHSVLTNQEGNSNQSQTATTSFSWKRYTASANYAYSSGLAVLNANGAIVPTPVAPLLSDYLYIFNAKVWGANGSARLFRRLTMSGGYTTISSNTQTGPYGVLTNGDRYYARMDYTLRRFQIQGGFSRVGQDVSTIPGGPRLTNSFYITLSRWFNVF